MATDESANRDRKVTLALAALAMTLALAILGGNIRNDTPWIMDWTGGQRTLFVLALVDDALVGWSPVRDFLRGDWRPFLEARLGDGREEDER